jgi:hypothetical protein
MPTAVRGAEAENHEGQAFGRGIIGYVSERRSTGPGEIGRRAVLPHRHEFGQCT